jgi:hypothetical protein
MWRKQYFGQGSQKVGEFPIVNNNNNKENLIIITINDRNSSLEQLAILEKQIG